MLEVRSAAPFSGGLRLKAHKADSTAAPLATLARPRQLCIPLAQRPGIAARLIVKIGDTVTRGERIGAPTGTGCVAVHASSPGRVVGVEHRAVPWGSCLIDAPCVLIDTRPADSPGASRAVREWPEDSAARLAAIRQAGIAGLGGAAFATDVKLAARRPCHTLILNGAECEPYISCDDMLMRERAASVVAGARLLLDLSGAATCLIAIENDKAFALDAMRRAAEVCADRRIVLATLPTVYPAGGERQLVESLLGKEVPSGGFPTDIGVLCQNVGTAYALAQLVARGEPLISRIVTVTGAGVREPQNVEVPIGAPISALLEHCGGLVAPACRLVVGGNMMGYALPHADFPVTKSTNCILALPEPATPAAASERPCIRCGECAGACPARLLPQELLRSARAGELERLLALGLDDCIECGCCDVVCPSHIPLTGEFRAAKPALARHLDHRQLADAAERHYARRQARLRQAAAEADAEQQALKRQLAADAAARRAVIDAAVRRSRGPRDEPDHGA